MEPAPKVRLKIFWRTLWLQSSWSFEGMQTIGFVHALGPALKSQGREKCGMLLKHLDFFNTHPFFAPAAIGAAARAENKGGTSAERASEERVQLMGPLGGMGDALFWGSVKPMAVLLGLILLIEGWLWAPLAAVAVFTAINLTARVRSLNLGLEMGREAVLAIQKHKPVLLARNMKFAVALMLGWLVWRLSGQAAGPLALKPWVTGAGSIAVTLCAAFATRREVDPLWIIYSAALAAIGIGFLQ